MWGLAGRVRNQGKNGKLRPPVADRVKRLGGWRKERGKTGRPNTLGKGALQKEPHFHSS